MWLGLLLDTIETRQGEGVAFLEEGVAFCIAGVAFFLGVMHLGRSVMHWGEACFHLGWRVMSDAFIVHDMGMRVVHFHVCLNLSRKVQSGNTQSLELDEI